MPGEIYDVDLRITVVDAEGEDLVTGSVSVEWPRRNGSTASRRAYFPVVSVRTVHSTIRTKSRIDANVCRNIGELLFAGEVRNLVRSFIDDYERVRINLYLDQTAGWLQELPWEAAYLLPELKEISLLPGVSFVRRRFPTKPLQPPSTPLKVAYAAGSDAPFGRTTFDRLPDPRLLLDEIERSVESGPAAGALELSYLGRCSWEELADAADGADVVHFSGHGMPTADGVDLVLSDANGKSDPISVDRYSELLAGDPRVLLLSACQSAKLVLSTMHRFWAELEGRCVILMRGQVTNSAADAFSKAFYLALAASGDLDDAIIDGRQAMAAAHPYDANAVVVYSRYPRGTTMLRKLPLVPVPATGSRPGTDPAGKQRQKADDRSRDRRPIVRIVRVDPAHNLLESWLGDNHFWTIVGPSAREPRAVTPLLGPGVTAIDPACGALRWDSLLEAATDPGAGDPAFSRFVRNLVDNRWDGSRRRLPFTPSTEEEASISAIRLDLGKLAWLATTEFAAATTQATVPLAQWDSHEVEIVPSDPLLDHFDQLIERLTVHNAGHGGADELFGGVFLESRLRPMRKELRAGAAGLTGPAIRWLTNVFWHAVIYDSPLYPSPEELEMQVSLFVNEDRPTRDFGAGASLIRYELEHLSEVAARALARGFDVDEPEDSPRHRLYRSIGALMHGQYAEWQARRPGSRWPLPLVVTSNLDLELERALAATGQRFHVALPVYFERRPGIGSEDDESGGGPMVEEAIRWLVGTFSGENPSPTIADLERPLATWQWLASLETGPGQSQRSGLEGPLLLKLNGSPLHQVPSSPASLGVAELDGPGLVDPSQTDTLSDVAPPGSFRVEHAIALGEFDFLQVTRVNQWSFDRQPGELSEDMLDGLPGWLVDEIRNNKRYWLLLGYDLADWTSRIQLHTFFTHVSRRTDRGCAIAADFDEVRLRFLDWLGIAHARGAVAKLTPALERLAAERLATGRPDGLHAVGGPS
jgi:hypothetical protein